VIGLHFTLVLSNTNKADAITRVISYNDGRMPGLREFDEEEFEAKTRYRIDLNEEAEFRTRYFVVWMEKPDNGPQIIIDHIASVSEEDAMKMAEFVVQKDHETGYYGKYRYRTVGSGDDVECVIFLDCSEYFESQKATLNISIVLSVMFALLISFIFASLSSKILRPFEQNQKAQKQFITDASHELKTPLAIISANAEVLKYKNGENEWTENIVSQTEKMSHLINQLLILSRMEEVGDDAKKEMLDYSEIVKASLNKFSEVFNGKNVSIEAEINDHVSVLGVRNQIENLCDILIENASKYVTQGGLLKIKLEKTGKKTELRVFNTARLEEGFDGERIFDRFFRTDKSRTSSTGGHGIGLSIAKRITEQHHGIIKAVPVEDGVEFSVII
jgi:hypothetical protein